MKTTRTAKTTALKTIDAMLDLAKRNLTDLMARGQDASYKVQEIDGLLKRKAELEAR